MYVVVGMTVQLFTLSFALRTHLHARVRILFASYFMFKSRVGYGSQLPQLFLAYSAVECKNLSTFPRIYIPCITKMLISKSHHDIPCKDKSTIRIFVISPVIPEYPQARFPGMDPSTRCDLNKLTQG